MSPRPLQRTKLRRLHTYMLQNRDKDIMIRMIIIIITPKIHGVLGLFETEI